VRELTDNPTPLQSDHLPDPVPAEDDLLIKVHTSGVCHTELDDIEGRTVPPRLPIVLDLMRRTPEVLMLDRYEKRTFDS
jgi:NADPH:quinone reductase-like Zn-dependent oxidoreductase